MAAQTRLNELAERKRLLVLQAELHRAVLQAELVNARTRLQWIGQARARLSGGSWWLTGGVIVVFWALRRWRSALKWLPTGLALWRWLKKFKPA